MCLLLILSSFHLTSIENIKRTVANSSNFYGITNQSFSFDWSIVLKMFYHLLERQADIVRN